MESESLLRQAFGLNAYEARAYLSLAGRKMRAKEVSEASGVPLSRTYDTLRALARMGFVSDSSGVFAAARPSAALKARMTRLSEEFEKEQEGRLRAMARVVSELEEKFSSPEGERDPVLLKGMDSIASAFIEVLRSSNEVFLLVRRGVEAGAAFLGYIRGEVGSAAKVKVLVPRQLRLAKSELAQAKTLGLEVRRGPQVLMDMMVGSGSDVILGVPAQGKEESFGAVAVWIRNGSFASTLRRTIGQDWKEAEKA